MFFKILNFKKNSASFFRKNSFCLFLCFLTSLSLTSCETAKVLYEKVSLTQAEMLQSYRSQNQFKKSSLSVRALTLNAHLLNIFLIKNPQYKESIQLFEEMLEDGRFLKEISSQRRTADFIALQEFFKEKDLRGILDRAYKVGYISAFDLFKEHESSNSYRRDKIGLDIWVRKEWLKGKRYGKDYKVGFWEYKDEYGLPVRHIIEALGAYRRGLFWIEISLGNGKSVFMGSTHLTPLKVGSWARKRFLQTELLKKWSLEHDSDFFILSGDMNSAPYFEMDGEANPDSLARYTRSYVNLISQENLYDSFYVLYPEEKGFTYDNDNNTKKSENRFLNFKNFDPEHIEKIRKEHPGESLEENLKEYNEYVKNKNQEAKQMQILDLYTKQRIDFNFFRGSKKVFVELRESEVVFDKPFFLRSQENPLFLSDHYGLVSEAIFWF